MSMFWRFWSSFTIIVKSLTPKSEDRLCSGVFSTHCWLFLSGVPIDVLFGLRTCVLRDMNDSDKSSLWEQHSLSDHLSQISQQESVAVKKL